MSFQKIFKRGFGSFLVITTTIVAPVMAQQVVPTSSNRQMPVATGANLYCAGYVQNSPIGTGDKIVGAVEEQERFNYSQNNLVYINMGADKGVKVGDMFSVVRPKGQVKSRWAKKDVGFFVQEVGALEVVNVKPQVAVARIKTSCDTFLLGDLVQPTEVRVAPDFARRPSMDLFADPTGSRTGRIFLAREGQEMLTRDTVVYVDLGADDNVKVGDYLTVYRPLGKGGVLNSDRKESVSASEYGFESDRFRGGKFSNQSPRKKGSEAKGGIATFQESKSDRPKGLRKVVGEAVIVNVKERTATAVITRNAQEIVTGDFVEVQ